MRICYARPGSGAHNSCSIPSARTQFWGHRKTQRTWTLGVPVASVTGPPEGFQWQRNSEMLDTKRKRQVTGSQMSLTPWQKVRHGGESRGVFLASEPTIFQTWPGPSSKVEARRLNTCHWGESQGPWVVLSDYGLLLSGILMDMFAAGLF